MAAKKKRGRPEAEIDLKVLRALAFVGCTDVELAAYFGVCERTITNKKKDPDFLVALERGEALGNVSLRKKQMQKALKGDNTMLVWLGKQRLGQKDKIDHSGKVETPAPPKIHVEFVSPEDKPKPDGEPQK